MITKLTNLNHLLQAKYVAQCMEEIKEELRQENPGFKANAVAKLTYVSKYDASCQQFTDCLCQHVTTAPNVGL